MYFGRVAVRFMLFPYGSRFIYRLLDSQLNENFGREFHGIMERTLNIIMNYMVGDKGNETDMEQMRFALNQSMPRYLI